MQTRRSGRWTAAAVLAALAIPLTACGSSSSNKAGGDLDPQPVVLRLASITGDIPPQLEAFAEEVDQRSDRTLQIEFEPEWRLADPNAERGTIEDVKAGVVDMAWVGARVFDTLDMTSFQALLAPLLVDNYALEAKVFESEIPASMLEGVAELGVVGIGVLPGPIRRLLGVDHPFLEPSDFAGQVIGGAENELSVRTFQALGATLEPLPAGGSLDGLDATEQHLGAIWGNRYDKLGHYVGANVNLWPRPLVILAGEEAFDSLSPEHRVVLREAATAAVPAALAAARADDEEAALSLCGQGMTFAVASEAEIAELRRALQPLYAELMADAVTKANIDAITSLKTEIAASAEAPTCTSTEPPGTASLIPDGRYEMTLTNNDWLKAGISTDDMVKAGLSEEEAAVVISGGVFAMIFDAGEWELIGPKGDGEQASYTVYRDTIVVENSVGEQIVARWSLEGESLTFTDVDCCGGNAELETVLWTSHPWVKTD